MAGTLVLPCCRHKFAGKQCRERWVNHLDPSLKAPDVDWTIDEDEILIG
jgi:hypothetical protein